MFNKVLLSSAACLLALGSFAHASTITEVYNLNTSADLGNVQAGTITLSQNTLNPGEVDVTVALGLNYSFRNSGSNHTSFAFDLKNISTAVGAVTVGNNVTTGFTFQGNGSPGSYEDPPYSKGTGSPFQYAFQCDSSPCVSGPIQGSAHDIKTLSFSLFATGLTDDSFTAFVADLIEWDGKGGSATGSITTGGTPTITTFADPTPVPEPSSLVLLGSGLVGAAGMIRRKIVKG